MNVLFFLTHKANCNYIFDDFTIRQALEKMEQCRYSSIPVLNRAGEYVGTISEGDLLWAIKNKYMMNMRDAEESPVLEVPRRKDYLPVSVTATPQQLMNLATEQNFVPVVDDKDSFIGIVTRQKIMKFCMVHYLEERAQ